MKVNVMGRGLVPGLKTLAPVRDVDLSEIQINKILKYRFFQVYQSSTGKQITNKNLKEFFMTKKVEKKPTVKVSTTKTLLGETIVVESVKEEKEVPVVETKLEDVAPEELPIEVPEDAEVLNVESVEDILKEKEEIEKESDDENVEEEETENTESKPYYKKKKRKH